MLYAYASVFILLVWERGDVEGWHSLSFLYNYLTLSTLTRKETIEQNVPQVSNIFIFGYSLNYSS